MTPYYQHAGVTIYHGDARGILPSLSAEAIITDPVWPNSIFPKVADPQQLLAETLAVASCCRVVVHLGCDSDPRFLEAVPKVFPFFRVCWLEFACPSYKGRLLYSGDVAYAFGEPPTSEPGAHVIPGRKVSTKSEKGLVRGNGRNKDQGTAYMAHPCSRKLQHVRWLCKWFGGASVIDPFGGSGTTAVACKLLGIPSTLIEIEELAVSRLAQEMLTLVEEIA